MVKSLMSRLVSMFGRTHSKKWRKEMLTWAQVEYKKDWQYAYNYILEHKDLPPKRYINGVTQ